MEMKTAEDLLTARALRARSRASIELSKKRKNVYGQATQGAEFFVIFLAIHLCCVYLCDSVRCEIVKRNFQNYPYGNNAFTADGQQRLSRHLTHAHSPDSGIHEAMDSYFAFVWVRGNPMHCIQHHAQACQM